MEKRSPFSKVSDLRNWVGMSESGMKLYESKGIIRPDRDAQSGYRRLNISDGDKMFRGRVLTGYGFTVQDAANILLSSDFDEQYVLLGEKEDELNEEIIELSYRLRLIRDMRKSLQQIRAGGVDDCGRWLSHVPYVTSAVMTEVGTLDEYGTYWYGPVMEAVHAHRLGVPLANALPVGDKSPHYVWGFCRYPLNRNIRREDCRHLMDFAEKSGKTVFGSLIAKHILLENTESGMITYDEILIPVR